MISIGRLRHLVIASRSTSLGLALTGHGRVPVVRPQRPGGRQLQPVQLLLPSCPAPGGTLVLAYRTAALVPARNLVGEDARTEREAYVDAAAQLVRRMRCPVVHIADAAVLADTGAWAERLVPAVAQLRGRVLLPGVPLDLSRGPDAALWALLGAVHRRPSAVAVGAG